VGSTETEPDAVGRVAIIARLRAAGCVFAEDEAALLVSAAQSDDELERMVCQRVQGLPIEHVIGWAEFCGLRIAVDPRVFVPRRRSEALVREAIRLAQPKAVVLDLCCGSGAIGAAIAGAVPLVQLHAADIEPAAVACARRNLDGIGRVHESDLYEALPRSLLGSVDVLVVNAPYVPTDSIAFMPAEARLHEPLVTLDGGGDGTAVQRRVAAEAPVWLAPVGHLLIETSEEQASTTAGLVTDAGLVVRVVRDEVLDATVVIASAPPVTS
jgi:release factor glutamine methyltransferase